MKGCRPPRPQGANGLAGKDVRRSGPTAEGDGVGGEAHGMPTSHIDASSHRSSKRLNVRMSRGSAAPGRRGSGRSAASLHDTPWGSGVGPTARVSRTCAADQAPGDDRRCSGHGRQDEPQHTDRHEHDADFFGQVFDLASPTLDGRRCGLALVRRRFGLSVRGRGVHGVVQSRVVGLARSTGATAPGRHSGTNGRSWPLWIRASSASAILLSSLSNVLNTLRSLLRRRLIS